MTWIASIVVTLVLVAAIAVLALDSLIGAVVAEWTGASSGLGRTMWLAYSNLNLPYLFAAIFLLAAAGMTLYWLVASAEQKAIFWQAGRSEE